MALEFSKEESEIMQYEGQIKPFRLVRWNRIVRSESPADPVSTAAVQAVQPFSRGNHFARTMHSVTMVTNCPAACIVLCTSRENHQNWAVFLWKSGSPYVGVCVRIRASASMAKRKIAPNKEFRKATL